ncbi:MAG: DUF4412 domain-containing protein [bacterium]
MKRKNNLGVWLFVVSFVFLNKLEITSAQDFEGVIEQVVTTQSSSGGGESEEQKEIIYLRSNMMRIDEPDENQTTIIRLDKEFLWHIDHNAKTYTQVSFKQMRQGMQDVQRIMQEAMKNMTPEQRQMMENMGMKMPGMSPPKHYQLKKTGKKEKINGYRCEQYLLVKGDQNETEEWWVTKDLGSFQNFGKMLAKMFAGMSGGMTAAVEAMAKLEGIPIKTIEKEGDEVRISKVTKITKASVNKTQFEVPEGYKMEEMPQMPFGK